MNAKFCQSDLESFPYFNWHSTQVWGVVLWTSSCSLSEELLNYECS